MIKPHRTPFTWLIIFETTNRVTIMFKFCVSVHIARIVIDPSTVGNCSRVFCRTPPPTLVSNKVERSSVCGTVATRKSCKTCFIGRTGIRTQPMGCYLGNIILWLFHDNKIKLGDKKRPTEDYVGQILLRRIEGL